MTRTFRLRANRDRAPQATRPKTTHGARNGYPSKVRGGLLCSFCERLAAPDLDSVTFNNGVVGALCDRKRHRAEMRRLK